MKFLVFTALVVISVFEVVECSYYTQTVHLNAASKVEDQGPTSSPATIDYLVTGSLHPDGYFLFGAYALADDATYEVFSMQQGKNVSLPIVLVLKNLEIISYRVPNVDPAFPVFIRARLTLYSEESAFISAMYVTDDPETNLVEAIYDFPVFVTRHLSQTLPPYHQVTTEVTITYDTKVMPESFDFTLTLTNKLLDESGYVIESEDNHRLDFTNDTPSFTLYFAYATCETSATVDMVLSTSNFPSETPHVLDHKIVSISVTGRVYDVLNVRTEHSWDLLKPLQYSIRANNEDNWHRNTYLWSIDKLTKDQRIYSIAVNNPRGSGNLCKYNSAVIKNTCDPKITGSVYVSLENGTDKHGLDVLPTTAGGSEGLFLVTSGYGEGSCDETFELAMAPDAKCPTDCSYPTGSCVVSAVLDRQHVFAHWDAACQCVPDWPTPLNPDDCSEIMPDFQFWREWWFWVAIGVVVSSAISGGVVIYQRYVRQQHRPHLSQIDQLAWPAGPQPVGPQPVQGGAYTKLSA